MVGALKAISKYRLALAHEQEILANQYKDQAAAAIAESKRFKAQADELSIKLTKATDKANKLQAQIDKITVLPTPTVPPATTKLTLDELKKLGLSLVLKPSTSVAPSVAGITAEDATKVWFWGQEALRVPGLELKLDKTTELVGVLNKNITLANQVADTRNKEAEAAILSSNDHQKEAEAVRIALSDTKKALSAERKTKWLYAIGALGLGYAVRR